MITVHVHEKGGEEEKKERGGGEILAALHGILGPTGAAVPGENPIHRLYILASTVLFIRTRWRVVVVEGEGVEDGGEAMTK